MNNLLCYFDPMCLTAVCLTAVCLTAVCLTAVCLTAVCLTAVCHTAVCLTAVCYCYTHAEHVNMCDPKSVLCVLWKCQCI